VNLRIKIETIRIHYPYLQGLIIIDRGED
jgi:hypothetical protein